MAGNSAAVAEMEECAALIRDSGLDVYATDGWKDRGRSSDVNYQYLIAHHTAATDDITSMLINGRSDLPGPLCNWELQEYGRWGLIASGRANHAGEATVSSSESYGIEATGPQGYPDTYGPAAFPGNYDSYVVGCACILAVMNVDISRLQGHKEIALPAGRKIDPYFDMPQFRTAVGEGEDMANSDEILKIVKDMQAEIDVMHGELNQLRYGDYVRTEDGHDAWSMEGTYRLLSEVSGNLNQLRYGSILREVDTHDDWSVEGANRLLKLICEKLGIPVPMAVDTSTLDE